jgi:hypothetical protein
MTSEKGSGWRTQFYQWIPFSWTMRDDSIVMNEPEIMLYHEELEDRERGWFTDHTTRLQRRVGRDMSMTNQETSSDSDYDDDNDAEDVDEDEN